MAVLAWLETKSRPQPALSLFWCVGFRPRSSPIEGLTTYPTRQPSPGSLAVVLAAVVRYGETVSTSKDDGAVLDGATQEPALDRLFSCFGQWALELTFPLLKP